MYRREALRRITTISAGVAAASILPGSAADALAQQPAAPPAALPRSTSEPGIFLNQVGYLPEHGKVASVANLPEGAAAAFRVLAVPRGNEVYAGSLTSFGELPDESSGDRIWLADFSSVKTPGQYRLAAAGMQSEPFAISPTVYREALRTSMRSFYGQRCGCKVNLGGGYKHPKCHQDGAYHPTSGRAGKLKNTGGWHDAGDYGRYVVNSGISTGTLLWAWEMFPEAVKGLHLGIPKTHGAGAEALPDWLAEIKWNLDWMISLQDEDGGVWHKQTSAHFCAFIMPQADKLTSYVIGSGHAPYKTTAATADLASVAAIAARVYAPYDAGYAARCLTVARNAWQWAMAHPEETYENPPGILTGGYGDPHLGDERMWASAELWRTTGEELYELSFRTVFRERQDQFRITAPNWGGVESMACWSYVLTKLPGSEDVKERIRAATRAEADRLTAQSAVNGYGNTLAAHDYHWGSNSNAANQSMVLLVDYLFEPTPERRTAALNNLHYLLGRNCHGVSWVTHVGTKPFMHPHHRPSASDGILEPWPGLLSGGPNAHGGDAVADTMPKQPPMRMWVDDERAYSMNEIAINWNAPLVFVLAAACAMR